MATTSRTLQYAMQHIRFIMLIALLVVAALLTIPFCNAIQCSASDEALMAYILAYTISFLAMMFAILVFITIATLTMEIVSLIYKKEYATDDDDEDKDTSPTFSGCLFTAAIVIVGLISSFAFATYVGNVFF